MQTRVSGQDCAIPAPCNPREKLPCPNYAWIADHKVNNGGSVRFGYGSNVSVSLSTILLPQDFTGCRQQDEFQRKPGDETMG